MAAHREQPPLPVRGAPGLDRPRPAGDARRATDGAGDDVPHRRPTAPRDYYVRAFSNAYSVDPAMIGRVVDVTAGLDSVTDRHHGVLIAAHRRKWARQLIVTDPANVLCGVELRGRFQCQRARRPAVTAAVEMASLDRYDELISVDLDAAPTLLAVASCSGRKLPRRSTTPPRLAGPADPRSIPAPGRPGPRRRLVP